MDLLSAPREIDYAHPGERSIFDGELRAEGLVLHSREITWSDKVERQILAVVAGEDGPQLIGARTWPASFGGEVITRIDLNCSVEGACKRFLAADTDPRALTLTPHTDVGILAAYPGRITYLWRSGIQSDAMHTIYLLRQAGPEGIDLILASDTVRNGKSEVVEHGRVSANRLREWANETFELAAAPSP